jgi:hypothetical protein
MFYLILIYEEFLFQHEHWHVKKHGIEGLFSGLKNVKYQKYLSRPHVGNKLQVTRNLFVSITPISSETQGTNVLQEREAINTLDPEWYMYQEKFKVIFFFNYPFYSLVHRLPPGPSANLLC